MKLSAIVAALLLSLGLVACGDDKPVETSSGASEVVASEVVASDVVASDVVASDASAVASEASAVASEASAAK